MSDVLQKLDLGVSKSTVDPFSCHITEQCVLGAILIDNHVFYKVEQYITPGDFTDYLHSLIYKRMAEVIPKNHKVNALYFKGAFREELPEHEFNSVHADNGYFIQLAESVLTTSNAVDHAKILRKHTIKRLLQQWLLDASNDNKKSVSDKDPQEIISYLEDRLFKLASKQLDYDCGDIELACDQSIEWLINRSKIGLKTGIDTLDEITGTWSEGDFVILGALTGLGKTALACSFIRNWCEQSKKVACFSMEMTRNQMLARIASTYDNDIYKRPGDAFSDKTINNIHNAYKPLRNFNVGVYEYRRTISEIRAILRQHKIKHGLDVIVIDYLGLVKPDNPKASKYEQASQVSTSLKGLAMEFKVPLLSLCQMNREAAKDNRPPRVSELRDSGQIEQDADLIMLLHRKMKGDEPDRQDFRSDKNYHESLNAYHDFVEGTEILVRKSRHWKPGNASVEWTGTRYISMEPQKIHKGNYNG